jgi:hypothetical protein
MQNDINSDQKNSATSRQLKIHRKIKGRGYAAIDYPEIILAGLWLQRLGFEPGMTINVTTIERDLVISLADT